MKKICGLVLAGLLLAALPARADEGMWLFTNPPKKHLKEKYGFDVTPEWLEHVQKSSVRFPRGSGSFVSADGLVMTNHHVASGALQKLSDKEGVDYVKNGFHARTRDKEKKCDGLELRVLMSMDNVTDQVNAAVKPDMKPAEAFAARRAIMAKIEKESLDKTKLKSDVVTLYHGGQYWLYRYKLYKDIRVVFAPEKQIAFFGGDPDNFEFPRYDLDVTFFRAYEDGKPARIKHYLKWSKYGAADNELVFVSGHPGRTNRLNTLAELKYLRDRGYPYVLQRLNRQEVLLSVYSERNAANRRKAEGRLFGVANSRKAIGGMLGGLLDPELLAHKAKQEQRLREAVARDEKLKDIAGAWKKVADVQKIRARLIRPYVLWEAGSGFNSELFDYARLLVRSAEERTKPNSERLEAYQDANKATLERQLFTPVKLYNDYEILKLSDGLTFLCEQVGEDNPLVKKVLAGKSPSVRAAELVTGCKLKDVAERKKLYEGGKKAIDACADPMIALAKLVDPESRKVRKEMETEVEEVKRQAYAQIAKAQYAVEGATTYPDATFTLRLAFGPVKGYEESGQKVPFETTFEGLYKRSADHEDKYPFNLPPIWMTKKDKLNLKTPFNFVCTADIIGGNSGSPVINKKAEVVGLIFDGNIQSLVWDFVYGDKQGRALAVHSRGIVEALSKVYEARALVDELTGKKAAASSE